MTLALLITAVGGAWAQDYDINVDFNSTYDRMGTTFNCMIMNLIDPGVGVKGTLELSVDDVSKGSFGVDGEMVFGSIAAIDAGDHTWTAEFKPEGGGSFKRHGDFRIDKVHTSISYDGSTSINMGVGESTELDVHVAPDGADGLSYSSSDASVVSITKENSFRYIIQAEAAGTATITFSFAGNINYNAAEDLTITVTVAAPEPTVEVTTNAAEEGATFTEATFAMPAFDATAEYELVRDMGYKVAFSGVPTRARLAKDGNGKFHFADGLTFQLLDNIDAANPKDITSAEGITFMVGEVEAFDIEGNTFYQLNKETLVPLADFLADAHLGNYAICAVASTGEYDGSFSSAMPSNTPMLVYNKSNETKVILLIPCAEPDMAITVAPEFQGTLTGTTIAASTEGQTNYAFNGKAFVFVKNAIEVGPNKAWLSVNTGVPSARITLVFDDATGVGSIENGKLTIDNWYDLNGRKLQGMPTKKGVYILNGKKVVVK